jgi:hypothetical protein
MFVVKINQNEEYVEVCQDLDFVRFFQTEDEAIDCASEINEEMDARLAKLVDGDYSHINSPCAVWEPVTSQVLVASLHNGVELADSYADVVIDFPEVELLNTSDFYDVIDHPGKIVCGRLNKAEIVNQIIQEYTVSSY